MALGRVFAAVVVEVSLDPPGNGHHQIDGRRERRHLAGRIHAAYGEPGAFAAADQHAVFIQIDLVAEDLALHLHRRRDGGSGSSWPC